MHYYNPEDMTPEQMEEVEQRYKTKYKGIPRRDALARLRNVEASGNREEMKTKEDIDRSRVGKKIEKIETLLARVKAAHKREDVYKRDNLAEEAIDLETAVQELLERVFLDGTKDELWGREWKGGEGAAIYNDEA